MKVHKIELVIIDHDELGADEIRDVLEYQKYPNRCIHPRVTGAQTVEIGDWHDDHPLNSSLTFTDAAKELFELPGLKRGEGG